MVWDLDKESSDGIVMSGETEKLGTIRKPWKWQTGNCNIQIDWSKMTYIKVTSQSKMYRSILVKTAVIPNFGGHFTPFSFYAESFVSLSSKVNSAHASVCESVEVNLRLCEQNSGFTFYKRACSLKNDGSRLTKADHNLILFTPRIFK